jgi:hypothetical protein
MRAICVGGPSRYDGHIYNAQLEPDGFLWFEPTAVAPGAVYRVTEDVRDTRDGPARVVRYVGEELPPS